MIVVATKGLDLDCHPRAADRDDMGLIYDRHADDHGNRR